VRGLADARDLRLHRPQRLLVSKSTCAPGACIAAAGACAVSSTPDPSCDPKVPLQQLCDGNQIYRCGYGYRLTIGGRCAGVCAMGPMGAICATSATPDPNCDPAAPTQNRCDGTAILYTCAYGYREDGSAYACPSGKLCFSNAAAAVCLATNAVASASCPQDKQGPDQVCIGTTSVTCVVGQVVDNQRCATCDPTGGCTGMLASGCNNNTECASGMVCHGATAGSPGLCTAACTGIVSGNPQCLAAAFSASFPYDATRTTCNQGWCGY